uniref:Glutaredoxin domain-containing protein n=1 Tax=Megaviridae environmental sample TaxID=1737588 RepID=A0A5J6VI05_9VIRU|nr:MAG: hypothetical protein [Megaviridae environmental sample]
MTFCLFYSPRCKFCIKLHNKIKEHNLPFKEINIDTVDRSTLPSFLERVPAIIAKDTPQPLIGKMAFDWLDTQLQFNQTSNNIYAKKDYNKESELLVEGKTMANTQNKDKFSHLGDKSVII